MELKVHEYLNFISHTKLNPKWITERNVRDKKTNVLEKNIGENLCDLWLAKEHLETKKSWALGQKKLYTELYYD